MTGKNVRWKGGRDVALMSIAMRKRFEEVKNDVATEVDGAVEYGGGTIQDLLEAAHTPTGVRRADQDSSKFPGRHVSGNMIASVGYGGARPSRSRILGFFGWFGGNFEDYFRDQDKGGQASDGSESEIPAANALPTAFLMAREELRRRLLRMGLRRR